MFYLLTLTFDAYICIIIINKYFFYFGDFIPGNIWYVVNENFRKKDEINNICCANW